MGGGLRSLASGFIARLVVSTLILTLLAASPGVAAPITIDRSNFKYEDLATPTPVAPSGITFDRAPEFAWRAVADATTYEFAVADSAGKRVFRRDGIKGSSFRIPGGSPLSPGDYSFTVRAYDHKDHRASQYSQPMTFTIIDAGQTPPAVTFSVADTVTLDGAPTLLSWSVDNANTVVIDNGIGAVTSTGTVAVYPAFDTTWTLVASGRGGNTTATAAVHVNHAPTVSPSVEPSIGPAPAAVRFVASAQDPDGDPVEYSWDIGDDGSIDASGSEVALVLPERGTYPARLTVSDGYEATATAVVTATVTSPLPTINASIEPSSILAGEGALLTWQAPDAEDVTLLGAAERLTPSGVMVISPATDTTYTLVARNESGEATVHVPISVNCPPVARIAVSPEGTLSSPAHVTLNGSASDDADGRIAAWEWTIDGIRAGDGPTQEMTLEAGRHVVSLEVTGVAPFLLTPSVYDATA